KPINVSPNLLELTASLIIFLLFEHSVEGYLLLCADPFSMAYLLLFADMFLKDYLLSRLRLRESLEGLDSESK
ncbi:hypothetical protein GIB67_002105, partial [Kingdonia uniflora]